MANVAVGFLIFVYAKRSRGRNGPAIDPAPKSFCSWRGEAISPPTGGRGSGMPPSGTICLVLFISAKRSCWAARFHQRHSFFPGDVGGPALKNGFLASYVFVLFMFLPGTFLLQRSRRIHQRPPATVRTQPLPRGPPSRGKICRAR